MTELYNLDTVLSKTTTTTMTLGELIEEYRYMDLHCGVYSQEEILEMPLYWLECLNIGIQSVSQDAYGHFKIKINVSQPTDIMDTIKAYADGEDTRLAKYSKEYLAIVQDSVFAKVTSSPCFEVESFSNYHRPFEINNEHYLSEMWIDDHRIGDDPDNELIEDEVRQVLLELGDFAYRMIKSCVDNHDEWITSDEYILDMLVNNDYFGWEIA